MSIFKRHVQTCPRRMQDFGPWERKEGLDRWRKVGPDRVCSFCGSMQPEAVLELAKKAIAGEPGVRIEGTTKRYKLYITRDGIKNASQAGIKFYAPHLHGYDEAFVTEFLKVVNKAAGISRQKLREAMRS